MKKIIVFETVDEILRGFEAVREVGEDRPFIPFSVSLIHNNDCLGFMGDGSDKFQISPGISYYDLVDRVLEIQGVRVCNKEVTDEQK